MLKDMTSKNTSLQIILLSLKCCLLIFLVKAAKTIIISVNSNV